MTDSLKIEQLIINQYLMNLIYQITLYQKSHTVNCSWVEPIGKMKGTV